MNDFTAPIAMDASDTGTGAFIENRLDSRNWMSLLSVCVVLHFGDKDRIPSALGAGSVFFEDTASSWDE